MGFYPLGEHRPYLSHFKSELSELFLVLELFQRTTWLATFYEDTTHFYPLYGPESIRQRLHELGFTKWVSFWVVPISSSKFQNCSYVGKWREADLGFYVWPFYTMVQCGVCACDTWKCMWRRMGAINTTPWLLLVGVPLSVFFSSPSENFSKLLFSVHERICSEDLMYLFSFYVI